MIDMASVFADRYRKTPKVLSDAVMGQSIDPNLDPYTALNALKLVNESQRMAAAGQAQQPTSSPSLVAEALAPAPSAQGLGAMVPNTMGQAPQGMPPQGMPPQQRAPMPQQPMQAASGGLAGMYSPEEDYAEGGIVAFQSGGETEGMPAPAVSANSFDDYMAGGDGAPSSTALSRAEEALTKYMGFVPKEMSEKEQEAFLDRYMARVKKAGGEDIYAPEIARGAQDEADRAKARRVGEAGAYFTAAGKVLKGRNLAEGASEALPAFGSAMSEVEKLDQAAKTANARAQFLLKDAQRKERMGDARGAQAALAEARKFQQDANRAEGDKLRFSADIAARTVGYSKVNKGAGAGGASSKDFIVGPETYLEQIKEEHPEWSPAKQKAEAFKLFQQGKSAGLQGAVIKADTAREGFLLQENINVQKAMKSFLNNPRYLAADAAGEGDAVFAAELEKQRALFPKNRVTPPAANPAAAPTSSSTGDGQRDYSNLWNQTPK